jgi:heme-binding NEAT domain protein
MNRQEVEDKDIEYFLKHPDFRNAEDLYLEKRTELIEENLDMIEKLKNEAWIEVKERRFDEMYSKPEAVISDLFEKNTDEVDVDFEKDYWDEIQKMY